MVVPRARSTSSPYSPYLSLVQCKTDLILVAKIAHTIYFILAHFLANTREQKAVENLAYAIAVY